MCRILCRPANKYSSMHFFCFYLHSHNVWIIKQFPYISGIFNRLKEWLIFDVHELSEKRDSTRAKDTGVFQLSHFSESIVRWSSITDWKTILPCKYTVIFFFTIQIEVKLNYFRSISDCVFFQLTNEILVIECQTTINVLREKGSTTVDIPTRKSLQWKMGARGRDFSIWISLVVFAFLFTSFDRKQKISNDLFAKYTTIALKECAKQFPFGSLF